MIKKTLCIVFLLLGGALVASEAVRAGSRTVSEKDSGPTYEQQMQELTDIEQQVEQYIYKSLPESDAAKFSRLLHADIQPTTVIGDAYVALILAVAAERERISVAEAERIRGARVPEPVASATAISGTGQCVGRVVDQACSIITQLRAELVTVQQQLAAEREKK